MNAEQLAGQVRFALSELSARNAAHEFEDMCRHVARSRLVSNLLPATGPVSAGGDQGRDFETFRSYLRDELGPHGAFLAKVADGPVAFACTLQQDGLPTKIRDDVAKIVGSGSAVAMVYVFTAGPIAVGRRHELQRQIGEDHTVALEILDSFALAELLADPELFWIAVQYLRLPAELAPARKSGAADQLAAWYVADRDRWRARGRANPAIGELLDLRDGLRYATDNDAARADFPFWLGLMIELTGDKAPGAVRQRARYEVGVAQLQGGRDLSPADGHVAAFLDGAVASDDPVLLGDAVVLLTFAIVAFTYRRTALGREQLTRWHQTVLARARELLEADPPPTARARLLELIGRACFTPDPARVAQAAQPLDLPDARELVDEDGRPRAPMARKTSDDLIDVRQGLDAWIELAKALPDTPLFPVDMLAGMLEILASSLVDEPEWRELTDAVGAAVARAEGGAAAAERSHRRAAALLEADRTVEAIGEIHRARMEWWSGDHLRPTVMTSLLLGDCYRRLKLPQAAKQFALGAVTLAHTTGADDLTDLIPHGLLQASSHEYTAGNWCSAVQLADLGLTAQHTMIDAEIDPWAQDDLSKAMITAGMALRAARQLVKDDTLTAKISELAAHHGMLDSLEAVAGDEHAWSRQQWFELADAQLLGRPFDDLGAERIIRFAALGQQWTVRCANRWADVLAAERLAAAAQVLLVELARIDLLLLSTEIDVEIVLTAGGSDEPARDPIENLSTNDGRRWRIALLGYDGDPLDPDAVSQELLTALSTVLIDVSLLGAERFFEEIEPAFAAGLIAKVTAGRPYDELGAVISEQRFGLLPRTTVEPPGGGLERAVTESPELPWQDGPLPTSDDPVELLESRYEQIPRLMARTLARLRVDRRFQTTVALLRQQGWRDWHILTAAYNILLQRRLAAAGLNTAGAISSPAGARAATDLAYTPEADDEDEVPLGIFLNVEAMDRGRLMALLSMVRGLGLEVHGVPDLPAIEHFLAARFGYWNDDIEHRDPFVADT
ncbi:MAG: hypothetical protein QOC78_2877 [Solirubrobacteraceae bacterium]|nr:hypothetical protein [Solirubrobacteraceae bacterium]